MGGILAIIALSLLFFLFLGHFMAATALGVAPDPTFHIIDNPTGGDCQAVGTWDPSSHTCTLGRDIYVGDYLVAIEIDSDGVTLDGAAHTISPAGTAGIVGVDLQGRTGVTVENLNISGMFYGVYLQNSNGNMVAYVNAFYSGLPMNVPGGPYAGDGIRMDTSNGNVLTGNNFVANYNCGIEMIGSSNNVVTGNVISANGLAEASWGDGILLQAGASGNSVFENWIEANILSGITINDSANNSIHRNNFVNNPTQAAVNSGTGNSFNLAAPEGGNYWSNYNSPVNRLQQHK